MDTDSLISLIHDLYTLNKVNMEFLQGRVGGEDAYTTLRESAAKKIRHEFFPERGFGKARIEPMKTRFPDSDIATPSGAIPPNRSNRSVTGITPISPVPSSIIRMTSVSPGMNHTTLSYLTNLWIIEVRGNENLMNPEG